MPNIKSADRRQPPASEEVVLSATGLSKSFGGQCVLDEVDLTLHKGEVVLLRGENGSGKTTLLNILTGNLKPDFGAMSYLANETPRLRRFPRSWINNLNPFDHFTPEVVAQEGFGRTWQHIRLFGSQTLRNNIAVAYPRNRGENPLTALFAPRLTRRFEADIKGKADAMLSQLGLSGREQSSADMISLGQSKRVAIARAVAAGAKVLFLDEPLAGLDNQGIKDVQDILEALVREHHLTLIIVEHVFNQPHLHGLITTEWTLQNGKLLLHKNSHKPLADKQSKSGDGPTHPAWFSLLAGDHAEIINEPLLRGGLLTRIRRPDYFKQNAKPVLEINDLIVKHGPRTVIGTDNQDYSAGLNLSLFEGEIAIVQAPNGWEKHIAKYSSRLDYGAEWRDFTWWQINRKIEHMGTSTRWMQPFAFLK